MGDVVIRRAGQELRFTHEDFLLRGEPNPIWPYLRRISLSGEIPDGMNVHQIAVEHVDDAGQEEERVGGHNAHFHDMIGMNQLYASTREQRSAHNEMLLPDGSLCVVIHEWGQGTVDGEVQVAPEQLNSGRAPVERNQSFFRRLFRRNEG